MQNVCLGGLFARGTICKVPLFARLVSGPLVESRCAPKFKGDSCSFCVTGPWSLRRCHKNLSTTKQWELSRGRLHPRNLCLNVPNPNARVYKVLFIAVYYSSQNVICKQALRLYKLKCFTCFLKKQYTYSAFGITTKGLLSLQNHSICPPRTAQFVICRGCF